MVGRRSKSKKVADENPVAFPPSPRGRKFPKTSKEQFDGWLGKIGVVKGTGKANVGWSIETSLLEVGRKNRAEFPLYPKGWQFPKASENVGESRSGKMSESAGGRSWRVGVEALGRRLPLLALRMLEK